MLNKRFYKSIIGISKFILPVVLLLLLAPQLIRFSTEFSSMNDFFKTHQIGFYSVICCFIWLCIGLGQN